MSATVSVPVSGRWLQRLCSGQPHQIIASDNRTYLHRWFLWPRCRWLNCYVHHFVGSDDPSAEHDHPWWFLSLCLVGSYMEISSGAPRIRRPGTVVLRRAEHRHRVQLLNNAAGREQDCWTIIITGPRMRAWGFWCPNGETDTFVPWQQFGARGCADTSPPSRPTTERARNRPEIGDGSAKTISGTHGCINGRMMPAAGDERRPDVHTPKGPTP